MLLPDFPIWVPKPKPHNSATETVEGSLNKEVLVLLLLLSGREKTLTLKYEYPDESTPKSVLKPHIHTVEESMVEALLKSLQKEEQEKSKAERERDAAIIQLKCRIEVLPLLLYMCCCRWYYYGEFCGVVWFASISIPTRCPVKTISPATPLMLLFIQIFIFTLNFSSISSCLLRISRWRLKK